MKFIFSIIVALLFSLTLVADNTNLEKKRVILQVETNYGDFFIRLFMEDAPETSKNFLKYVKDNYYDNTIFHRVIPGFIIQGGGFEKGLIAKPFNAPIINESRTSKKNTKGTLGMALNTNKASAASQFYINLADNIDLDYSIGSVRGYTVFAEVIDGMDIIEKISKVQTRQITYYSTLYKRNITFHDYPEREIIIKKIRKLTQ